MLPPGMSDRAAGRRRELLDAAIAVFARKGFHAARVADITAEAGVAHGLLYHYFRSKDEVLETIIRETWQLLQADTERIASSGAPLEEQLRRFAHIHLGSWLVAPDLIRVLVREVGRSPQVGSRVGEMGGVFLGLQRIVEAAHERGEVRADCDPRLAAWVFYGALEEILTGWVLGQLPGGEQEIDRAVATVVGITHAGLAA